MAKFLAVLNVTYGRNDFGWVNIDATFPGTRPTLDDIRFIEAQVKAANRYAGAIVTQMIPLDGE